MPQRRSIRSGSRFSFTLLELLVVITIIAVLAALLVPSLSSAKDRANTVKCMSNIRQIHLAFGMYGNDYEVYPWAFDTNIVHWATTLQPYFQKAQGVSDLNARSRIIECPSRKSMGTNVVNTYGAHIRLLGSKEVGSPYLTSPPYPRQFPINQRPTELIMLTDVDQAMAAPFNGECLPVLYNIIPEIYQEYSPATENNLVTDLGNNYDEDTDGSQLGQIRWRHSANTAANCLFVDGHVTTVTRGTMRCRNIQIVGP